MFPSRHFHWLWTWLDQNQQMTCLPKSNFTLPFHSDFRLQCCAFETKSKINIHLKKGLWTHIEQQCMLLSSWLRWLWLPCQSRSDLRQQMQHLSYKSWDKLHFLPHVFLPLNFLFFALWTATVFNSDYLWLTGVTVCLLDKCQFSFIYHCVSHDTTFLY